MKRINSIISFIALSLILLMSLIAPVQAIENLEIYDTYTISSETTILSDVIGHENAVITNNTDLNANVILNNSAKFINNGKLLKEIKLNDNSILVNRGAIQGKITASPTAKIVLEQDITSISDFKKVIDKIYSTDIAYTDVIINIKSNITSCPQISFPEKIKTITINGNNKFITSSSLLVFENQTYVINNLVLDSSVSNLGTIEGNLIISGESATPVTFKNQGVLDGSLVIDKSNTVLENYSIINGAITLDKENSKIDNILGVINGSVTDLGNNIIINDGIIDGNVVIKKQLINNSQITGSCTIYTDTNSVLSDSSIINGSYEKHTTLKENQVEVTLDFGEGKSGEGFDVIKIAIEKGSTLPESSLLLGYKENKHISGWENYSPELVINEPVTFVAKYADLVLVTPEVISCEEIIIKEHYKCSECESLFSDSKAMFGIAKEDVVDTSGEHSWQADFTIDLEPTCTEQGLKSIHCDNCSMVQEEIVIDKLGHDLSAYVLNNDAENCQQLYTETAKCKREGCFYEDTRDSKTAGIHKPADELANVKPTTCMERGYTGDKVCKFCGLVLEKGQYTICIGHNMGTWEITKEPTEEMEGLETRYCSKCDYKEERTMDKVNEADKIDTSDNNKNNNILYSLSPIVLALIVLPIIYTVQKMKLKKAKAAENTENDKLE